MANNPQHPKHTEGTAGLKRLEERFEGEVAGLAAAEELLEVDVAALAAEEKRVEREGIQTDNRIKYLEDRINTLEGTVDQIRTATHNFREMVTTVQEAFSNLKERADTVDAKVSKLEERADAVDGKVNNLEKRADTVDGKVSKLETMGTKIKNYLDSNYNQPIVTPPTAPVIGLSQNPSKTADTDAILVSIAGGGFPPNLEDKVSISIKCGDDIQNVQTFSASTGPSGNLVDPATRTSPQFTYKLKPSAPRGQVHYVAATDGSSNKEDWTGQLWSNTISFTW
jgi:prefoldin subunit 5